MKIITPNRFGSFLSALFLAGVALPGFEATCRAQFPSGERAEQRISCACFRVTVDPLYLWLFEDPDGAGSKVRYPGFNGSTLTSPGLADFGSPTIVGESMRYSSPPFPPGSPAFVDIGGSSFPSLGNFHVTTPFPGLYPNVTWPVPSSPPSPPTMWTEIQSATLLGTNGGCLSSPLVPPLAPVVLKVGFFNGLRRSVGQVQATTTSGDFPARSFFDVFAQVNLPHLTGFGQDLAFPSGGVVLYNDDPLYVLNDSVDRLPPTLGYYHDPSTLAVPLKFKFDQPDGSGGYYWHAGEVVGNLELAGHGLFDPCSKTKGQDLVTMVLGTPTHSMPVAPVGGMFPGAGYPWPSSTYDSVKGTNFVGQPLDALTFANSGSALSFRHLSLSNLLGPITLPEFGNSATYTNSNVVVSCECSFDLLNYFSGSATGTIQVLIVNTNPSIAVADGGSGGTTNYYAELQNLDLTGSSFFGSFMLRESPTLISSGKHIVHTGSPGFRIAGYFDSNLELSLNGGGSWSPADFPMRLRLANPPCGANIAQLHVQHTNANEVVVTWPNPEYRLQGAAALAPHAVWADIAGTSPVVVSTDPANDIAYNSGSLGSDGNGTHGPGVVHSVPGALAGDPDAACGYNDVGGAKHTFVPYQAALNPPAASPFTVEYWAKPDADVTDAPGPCPLFNRVSAGNRSGWIFFQRSPTTGWNFRMYNGSGSALGIDISGGSNNAGTWSHVVAVWDGSLASLYVNGALVAGPTAPSGGYNASTAAILSVGSYDDGVQNPFNGAVDEVAFYAAALTGTEILAHYQSGINPPATTYGSLILSANPVEYLRLDESAPPNRFFRLVCQ